MMRAPFPPLVADADGLDMPPAAPTALTARMADVYGVDAACVLPVAGVAQAFSVIARRIALDGRPTLAGPASPALRQITRANRVTLTEHAASETGAAIVRSPGPERATMRVTEVAALAREMAKTLLVVDESLIEFEEAPSAVALINEIPNLIVVRALSYAFGLAGAPCAALIASPQLIASLRDVCEPEALSTPVMQLALAALAPDRIAANAQRIAEIRRERRRIANALSAAQEAFGPFVWIAPENKERADAAQRAFALRGEWMGERFLLALGAPEENDRALAAFGAGPASRRRRAELVRETKETRIVVRLDLDSAGACEASTGIGFFDHMLSQVALHGGFALSLSCAGDLDVDGHHTIEDCALALGAALRQALGDKRGLARFGFVLPMDEAEARVSIDLGGRPYLVFGGEFAAAHIGAYPTEMTEHVFRSLAQSMGASIHVHVTGANDHHKTEACYKAFGRALRQALRIEGVALPSTKGVIA